MDIQTQSIRPRFIQRNNLDPLKYLEIKKRASEWAYQAARGNQMAGAKSFQQIIQLKLAYNTVTFRERRDFLNVSPCTILDYEREESGVAVDSKGSL